METLCLKVVGKSPRGFVKKVGNVATKILWFFEIELGNIKGSLAGYSSPEEIGVVFQSEVFLLNYSQITIYDPIFSSEIGDLIYEKIGKRPIIVPIIKKTNGEFEFCL